METEIMEVVVKAVDTQIFQIATDWPMFWATLGAGVLAAFATVLAVLYTHRKTSSQYKETMKVAAQRHEEVMKMTEQRHKEELERFRKDKDEQIKANALVIIKPMIKYTTFHVIIENLIRNDIWDRVLLISGEDGFAFFDERETPRYECNKIFSLKNEIFFRDVKSLLIKTNSVLISDSGERTPYETNNFIDLLRSREEILFRLYGTEQRTKAMEYIEKRKRYTLEFKVVVDYLTLAEQQIKYEYEAKIIDIPESIEIKGEKKEYYSFRTEGIKDKYTVLDEITIPKNQGETAFRNLQDYAQYVGDRVSYRNEMSGREQGRGMLAELGINPISIPEIFSQLTGGFRNDGNRDEHK